MAAKKSKIKKIMVLENSTTSSRYYVWLKSGVVLKRKKYDPKLRQHVYMSSTKA